MNINKRYSKLKDWRFKMPNFSYCQTVMGKAKKEQAQNNYIL